MATSNSLKLNGSSNTRWPHLESTCGSWRWVLPELLTQWVSPNNINKTTIYNHYHVQVTYVMEQFQLLIKIGVKRTTYTHKHTHIYIYMHSIFIQPIVTLIGYSHHYKPHYSYSSGRPNLNGFFFVDFGTPGMAQQRTSETETVALKDIRLCLSFLGAPVTFPDEASFSYTKLGIHPHR